VCSSDLYFRLVLRSLQAGVEISYVQFDGPSEDPDKNTARLIEAIEDARLVPVARKTSSRSRPAKDVSAAARG